MARWSYPLIWMTSHYGWHIEKVKRYLTADRGVFTYPNDKSQLEYIKPHPDKFDYECSQKGIKLIRANPKCENVITHLMTMPDFITWISLTDFPKPHEEFILGNIEQAALLIRHDVTERVRYFPVNPFQQAAVADIIEPYNFIKEPMDCHYERSLTHAAEFRSALANRLGIEKARPLNDPGLPNLGNRFTLR